MPRTGRTPLRPSPLTDQPVLPQDTVYRANPSVRLLIGFAGFGAGSVNLAICSSFFAAGAPDPAMFLAGGVAGLWGAALLAGAVVFLAKDRLAGGRWARYALAAAAAAHLAAIAYPVSTAASTAAPLSMTQLSALLLTLMIIASLGWLGRHGAGQITAGQDTAVQGSTGQGNTGQDSTGQRAASVMRPGKLLLAAFAGAVLVAGITTPGLAASTAGQYAVPHGGHGNVAPGGHHQR